MLVIFEVVKETISLKGETLILLRNIYIGTDTKMKRKKKLLLGFIDLL